MSSTSRYRLRNQRKTRIKKKIQGGHNKDTLRLTVFRSTKHIYAQIIDDKERKTLVSESTMSKAFKGKMKYGGNLKAAALVGALLGEEAKKQGIEKVRYDRNGYYYAGRVKALADSVREQGIKF
jgi:large subunit ribosomal protein L18